MRRQGARSAVELARRFLPARPRRQRGDQPPRAGRGSSRGAVGRAGQLFSYDAVFEDMALRAQLRGRAAIVRYLRRALPALPYVRASVRHVAGAGHGGGYEWRADGQLVAAGAAALELSPDGTITKFTAAWDASLLDDQAITALAAHAADN